MLLIKCKSMKGEDIYVNGDNVAEIVIKEEGCQIYYTTADGHEDQVSRLVKTPIDTILRQIPEVWK